MNYRIAYVCIQRVTSSLLLQGAINFELEKLRIELRHIRGMYAMAQGEAIDASRKVHLYNWSYSIELRGTKLDYQ